MRSCALNHASAESVVALTGAKSPAEYRELPADDPVRRRRDIRKVRESLGWSPTVPLLRMAEVVGKR